MAKIKLVEPIVREALINVPETRGDNFLLYREVMRQFVDLDISLGSFLLNHVSLGIPSFETITRCRRKIQEKNPELKAKVEIREEEEQEYIDYSRK